MTLLRVHIQTLFESYFCICTCTQRRRPFVGQGSGAKKAPKAGSKAGSRAAGSGGPVAHWKQGNTAAAAADADADPDLDAEAEDGGAVVLGGMKQDEQERVLQEFRAGTVQVLLATCIGEEGLDVPQVS